MYSPLAVIFNWLVLGNSVEKACWGVHTRACVSAVRMCSVAEGHSLTQILCWRGSVFNTASAVGLPLIPNATVHSLTHSHSLCAIFNLSSSLSIQLWSTVSHSLHVIWYSCKRVTCKLLTNIIVYVYRHNRIPCTVHTYKHMCACVKSVWNASLHLKSVFNVSIAVLRWENTLSHGQEACDTTIYDFNTE